MPTIPALPPTINYKNGININTLDYPREDDLTIQIEGDFVVISSTPEGYEPISIWISRYRLPEIIKYLRVCLREFRARSTEV